MGLAVPFLVLAIEVFILFIGLVLNFLFGLVGSVDGPWPSFAIVADHSNYNDYNHCKNIIERPFKVFLISLELELADYVSIHLVFPNLVVLKSLGRVILNENGIYLVLKPFCFAPFVFVH